MRVTIFKGTIFAAATGLLLASCINDPAENTPRRQDPGSVTFVVSVPPSDGKSDDRGSGATRAAGREITPTGGNGHFPDGVPADYRNYNADADTGAHGTAFGGYPDAEAEAEAFEKAVTAMAANYEKSPAAKSADKAGQGDRKEPARGNAPATRAIDEGSDDDNRINEITVLLFNSAGLYMDRFTISGSNLSNVGGDGTRWQFTLDDMPDGNYKALFVANFGAGIASYISPLTEVALKAKTIDDFRNDLETPTLDAWNANPGSAGYNDFPMSSTAVDFSVPAEYDYSTRPIELARTLAKINVTNSVTGFEIVAVRVLNDNAKGRIVPAQGWKRGLTFSGTETNIINAVGPVNQPPNLSSYNMLSDPHTHTLTAGDGNKLIDEIFVFEKEAITSVGSYEYNNLCLMIAARRPGVFPTGNEGIRYFRVNLSRDPDPSDADDTLVPVDIVRNYKYDVNIAECNTVGYATVEEAYDYPGELVTTVVASEQTGPGDITYNGQYQLTTDRSVVVLPAGGKSTMKIYTDYDRGWNVRSTGVGITVTQGGQPITGRPNANTLNTPDEVEIGFTGSTQPVLSTQTFQIWAGELHKTITVVRLPSAAAVTGKSEAITPYVGAFWRAEQTGERLIALSPGVRWSAFVLDAPGGSSADWVRIDTKPSTDAGLWSANPFDGGESGFDRTHAVNSTVAWATGTTGNNPQERYYFRLGARGAFAPNFENSAARYAVVLVVPGGINNLSTDPAEYKLLYLRQGHEPDYLMRPQDGNPNGDPITPIEGKNRPLARKISPYNLTAPDFNGGSADQSVEIFAQKNPQYKGVFTDYPTQAGAHFRIAHPEGVRAYNPVGPSDWTGGGADMDVWDNLKDEYEMCPPGYHLPSDGKTSNLNPSGISIDDSELFQSLFYSAEGGDFLRTDNDNSASGYYADGYFDRRVTGQVNTSGMGYEENSAVSFGNSAVAYRGELFFNPTTRASVFLPYAGARQQPEASTFPGEASIYWSSSLFDDNITQVYPNTSFANMGWANTMGRLFDDRSVGNSVRCVADAEFTAFEGLVPAPPGVIGIKHSDLMALRAGTKKLVHTPDGRGLVSFPLDVSLTIKGSGTYKGTWVERIATTDPNIGSLEDEPVYTVYFKWGGLTAILGSDGTHQPGMVEVAWGFNSPDGSFEWVVGSQRADQGYMHIPQALLFHGTLFWIDGDWGDLPKWTNLDKPATGNAMIGDPCDFVNGGTDLNRSGWKTPLGNPWTYVDGNGTSTPFGGIHAGGQSERPWSSSDISAWWVDASEGVPAGAVSSDGKIFLPAAGWFDATDYSEQLVEQGTGGAYWTANMGQDQSTQQYGGYSMKFNKSGGVSQRDELDTSHQSMAMPIRCVFPTPIEDDLVMAAPGMIGIKKSDYDALQRGDKHLGDGSYSLTIRGSSTWKGNAAIEANTTNLNGLEALGGLESEPVYAVYFKWGSTVAMVGGADGDPFDKSKVVWVNPEYNLAQHPIGDNYDSFTFAENTKGTLGIDNNVVEDLRAGHGDPCMWVNGTTPQSRYTAAGGWRTPTFQENRDLLGTNNAINPGSRYTYTPNSRTPSDPAIGTIELSPGKSVSFITAGLREANYANGSMNLISNGFGAYYSSTSHSTTHAFLSVTDYHISPGSGSDVERSFNVRCVRDVPGVRVPRGVIGYYADGPMQGQLTLDGDKSFYNDPAIDPESRSTQSRYTVIAAYFKWGSLVAMDGSNEDRAFTSADVIAAPEEYNVGPVPSVPSITNYGIERLRAQIVDAGNGQAGYNLIQPMTGMADGETIPWESTTAQLEQALGDPCSYYFGNWSMPTVEKQAEYLSLHGLDPLATGTPFTGTPTEPAWLMDSGGKKLLPAAGSRANHLAGRLLEQGGMGMYWTSTAFFNDTSAALSFNSSNSFQLENYGRVLHGGFPVRCVNGIPIDDVTISGTISDDINLPGTPLATNQALTIGNNAKYVTLTSAIGPVVAQPDWHWEYAIGDDTSWQTVPGSDNKTSIKTSTHKDAAGIDISMVGGTNRFRVVASNEYGTVESNVITVSLSLPTLTYAILGSGDWSWNEERKHALRNAINNPNGVLNPSNDDAIIKTAGLAEMWSTTAPITAAGYLNNGFSGTTNGVSYSNQKPDILLYYSYGAIPDWNAGTSTSQIGDAIAQYVADGGTVLFGSSAQDQAYANRIGYMLNKIFPNTGTEWQQPNTIPDSTYRIYNLKDDDDLSNDPIVNGPFGDLSGGECYIGEENYGTFIVHNIPDGAVQIAAMRHPRTTTGGSLGTGTAGYPKEWSYCWYHEDTNFFYIGDCTAARRETTDYDDYAAVYDYNIAAGISTATGAPGKKPFGYWDSTPYPANAQSKMTYNAVLEMNALAWCMTRAARNGINPH